MCPLFSSYVFVCGGNDARYRALVTGRLCQMISVPDQGTLLRELAQVQRVLSGDAELDPYPFAAVGRRCRVKARPLRGVEGTVIERESITSLLLQVSMLGQGVAVKIDTGLLEDAEVSDGAMARVGTRN